MARVETTDQLRALYDAPMERALKKELAHLDRHCRRFIALSPFLVIASMDAAGRADVSPRGDRPGSVIVLDDHHLAIADWPGNNRLDTLSNLIDNPAVGLMFLIPGIRETMRVNGTAEIRDDEALRAEFAVDGRLPRTVIQVTVAEAYIHCAKAMMRSRLWEEDAKVERSALPTINQIIRDQMGETGAVESEEAMVERYRKILY